jgi:hypothetical protein
LLTSSNVSQRWLGLTDELNIYDAYSADLQTQQEFTLEVKRWKARWELYPTDQIKPIHLCGTLELVSENLYPKIYCILKIELTMPPSTATAEITFSGLKRVLRGTMEQKGHRPWHCYILIETFSFYGCNR